MDDLPPLTELAAVISRLDPGREKGIRAFASATSGPTHTKAAVTARLAHPQVQELLPCAVNQRAWWSRTMATASAALSTQHGIRMSCGLASSNPGRNIIALAHSTRPLHMGPANMSGVSCR